MEKERRSAKWVREKWRRTSGDEGEGRGDQMWDRGCGVRERITKK